MRIINVFKSCLAAVALASSFAMPAAAHGPIRFTVYYYDYNYETMEYNYVGHEVHYCDLHKRLIGSTGAYTEETYENECDT